MKRSVWALAALIAIISLGVVKFCLVQDLSALCGGGGRIVVEQMVWHQTVAAPGETIVLEEEQQTAIAAALEQVKWRRANWSSKSDREPRIDVHFSIVQANGSECRGHVLYCYGDGTVRMPDGWMHVGRWGRKHGRELYAQLATIVAERAHAPSAEKMQY